jgi:hypothetical protein
VFFTSLGLRPICQVGPRRNSSVFHFSLATPHLPKSVRANTLEFFPSLWLFPICPSRSAPVLFFTSLWLRPICPVDPRQYSSVFPFLSGHAHLPKLVRANPLVFFTSLWPRPSQEIRASRSHCYFPVQNSRTVWTARLNGGSIGARHS